LKLQVTRHVNLSRTIFVDCSECHFLSVFAGTVYLTDTRRHAGRIEYTVPQMPIEKDKKIFVAGHRGMVGSAIVQQLEDQGFSDVLMCAHDELDLADQSQVEAFFAVEKPNYVVIAAAMVGGIQANNSLPAEFIYKNLMIECNLIQASYKHGCRDLLFRGVLAFIRSWQHNR